MIPLVNQFKGKVRTLALLNNERSALAPEVPTIREVGLGVPAFLAVIMMPLTFIAGVYGMNFEVMPELKWVYGYPVTLGGMALVAALFTVHFYRKKWF